VDISFRLRISVNISLSFKSHYVFRDLILIQLHFLYNNTRCVIIRCITSIFHVFFIIHFDSDISFRLRISVNLSLSFKSHLQNFLYIFYNIDLHNCEQIFTHFHLNLSGKAFKVGDQHFSSVSDTLNGLKYMRIK
jgi:hypothetical protein